MREEFAALESFMLRTGIRVRLIGETGVVLPIAPASTAELQTPEQRARLSQEWTELLEAGWPIGRIKAAEIRAWAKDWLLAVPNRKSPTD
jgi:hypothetical protein